MLLALDINQLLINAGLDENHAPVGRAGVLRHSIDRRLHIGELPAAVGSHDQFRFGPCASKPVNGSRASAKPGLRKENKIRFMLMSLADARM